MPTILTSCIIKEERRKKLSFFDIRIFSKYIYRDLFEKHDSMKI